MKYKEQPIDDSKGPEQFGGCMGVRVYEVTTAYACPHDVTSAIPFKIKGDYVLLTDSGNYKVHWKQCRKLVEVKPREIWWCPGCFKHIGVECAPGGFTHSGCGESGIKMREVTDV